MLHRFKWCLVTSPGAITLCSLVALIIHAYRVSPQGPFCQRAQLYAYPASFDQLTKNLNRHVQPSSARLVACVLSSSFKVWGNFFPNGKKKQHDLVVSTYQACILLLFNNQVSTRLAC